MDAECKGELCRLVGDATSQVLVFLMLSIVTFACDRPADPTRAEEPASTASTESHEIPSVRTQNAVEAEPQAARSQDSGTCATMCDHTVSLGCGPREACVTACEMVLADKLCQQESLLFVDCALARPVRDWECSRDKVAALKDGICTSEQQRVLMCVEQLLRGGSR